MPPGNTSEGKAMLAIEKALLQHFGGKLNAPQQVQLNLMRPLLAFWLHHPGVIEGDGTVDPRMCDQFLRIHKMLEAGLKRLVELADPDNGPRKIPRLEDWIDMQEPEPDQCQAKEPEQEKTDGKEDRHLDLF